MSRSPHELLLQLRSLHERLSRRDLGQAVSNAALADVLVARSERALTASRLPVHSTPEQFLASAAARNSLATLLVVNRASASAAHDGVRAASEAWRAKEREREAAEHLVAAEAERRAEERRAAEQRETDDLSSARHRRDHGGAS
jgi:flagellar biosynthesis chaperone FliJ